MDWVRTWSQWVSVATKGESIITWMIMSAGTEVYSGALRPFSPDKRRLTLFGHQTGESRQPWLVVKVEPSKLETNPICADRPGLANMSRLLSSNWLIER